MWSVLHQLVQGHVGESGAIPPAPELRFSKPFFKGQPAKGFNDQLPLPEVVRLVDTRQMPRESANIAKYLQRERKMSDALAEM